MVSQILVLHEKHGDRYFDASTPEALATSCVKVLRERVADGYWYHREYAEPVRPLPKEQQEILALTDEQLATLPTAIREDMKTKRAKLVKSNAVYKRRKKQEDGWWNAVQLVLTSPLEEAIKLTVADADDTWSNQPLPLAYEILKSRRDYEYESIGIYEVQ